MLYILSITYGLIVITSIIRGSMGLYPLLLFSFPFILYPLNLFYLKKVRNLRSIVLLNLSFFIVCILVTLFFANIENKLEYFFIIGFYALFAFLVPNFLLNKPEKKAYLAVLDVNILIILVSFIVNYNLLHLVAVFVISVFSVYTYNEELKIGFKDVLKIILIAVISGLIVYLFLKYIAPDAGNVLVFIFNKITLTIAFIFKKLWQLILFLFSLFPETQPGEMIEYSYTDYVYNIEEQIPAETNIYVLIAMIIISIFVAIFLIVKLFIYLGTKSVTKSIAKEERIKEKHIRINLFSAIAILFKKVLDRIRLNIKLFKMRKTMIGKFYTAIFKNAVTPNHKRVGETPREYIERIKNEDLSIQEIEEYLYK